MKKPENLYDAKTGKQIVTFNPLMCVADPHQSGSEKIGVQVGTMKGESFICEDAALFGHTMSYTAIAGAGGITVYQISAQEALQLWPNECQNDIKLRVLDKYRWFHERLLKIESTLTDRVYKGGDSLRVAPISIAKDNA